MFSPIWFIKKRRYRSTIYRHLKSSSQDDCMSSLFHKLSAQADAGNAQLSHQNEGDSGKE